MESSTVRPQRSRETQRHSYSCAARSGNGGQSAATEQQRDVLGTAECEVASDVWLSDLLEAPLAQGCVQPLVLGGAR